MIYEIATSNLWPDLYPAEFCKISKMQNEVSLKIISCN